MRSLALALALVGPLAGGAPPPSHAHPPPPTTTPPPATPPPGDFMLAIGAPGSDSVPVPLVDGQDVTMIAGAQGGFHVWLAWRVRGAPAGHLVVERDANRVSDGTPVLRYRGDADVTLGADGWQTPAGPTPMFMCPPPIGVAVVGEPIAYRLTVSDEAGEELGSAAITLVPRCPDDAPYCAHVCAPNP